MALAVRRELGHTAILHTTHTSEANDCRDWRDFGSTFEYEIVCSSAFAILSFLFSLDFLHLFMLFFGSVIKQKFVSSLSEMLESYAVVVCTEAKKSKSGGVYVLLRWGGMRNLVKTFAKRQKKLIKQKYFVTCENPFLGFDKRCSKYFQSWIFQSFSLHEEEFLSGFIKLNDIAHR